MRLLRLLALLALAGPAGARERPGEEFGKYAGFALEHATLADVQASFGQSPLHEKGDAGEYEAWVCYAAKTAEVHFDSGEMGGGTELLGITLLPPRTPSKTCRKPGAPLPGFIGPIRLGQSVRQFRAATSSPLTWSGNTATAVYEYTIKHDREPMDVSISVLGTFRKGRLVKVQTWKIESL